MNESTPKNINLVITLSDYEKEMDIILIYLKDAIIKYFAVFVIRTPIYDVCRHD